VCRVLAKETFWKGSTTWPPPRRCIHRQLFLCTPPFSVRACVCTRSLAYICTCVSECVSDRVVYYDVYAACALCCCVVPRGPGLLRAGGAAWPAVHAVTARNGRRLAQPFAAHGETSRNETRARRPGKRFSAADCRERAHFRHPWTAADPWATAAVAAVLYRWWRCAPAGHPPPRGISPVREYYTRQQRRCVRACVRACVLAYVQRAVSVSYSIIYYINLLYENNNSNIL